MDISFSTGAGAGAWNLEECLKWAKANDFDAIRPNASGTFDPDQILQTGGDEINETLQSHDIYLAALSAHNNLLDDDLQAREAAQ